jgi:hypothetical protein
MESSTLYSTPTGICHLLIFKVSRRVKYSRSQKLKDRSAKDRQSINNKKNNLTIIKKNNPDIPVAITGTVLEYDMCCTLLVRIVFNGDLPYFLFTMIIFLF